MQLMLDDLLSKREVYENAKMYECVATLTTSIEIAEYLLEKEKEQIVEAYNSSINTIMLLPSGIKSQKGNAEDYYNRTYNQNRIRITETRRSIEGIGIYKQNK